MCPVQCVLIVYFREKKWVELGLTNALRVYKWVPGKWCVCVCVCVGGDIVNLTPHLCYLVHEDQEEEREEEVLC